MIGIKKTYNQIIRLFPASLLLIQLYLHLKILLFNIVLDDFSLYVCRVEKINN